MQVKNFLCSARVFWWRLRAFSGSPRWLSGGIAALRGLLKSPPQRACPCCQPPFGLPASIPTAGQGIKIPNSIFNPKICNAIFISVRIYCKCSGSLLAKVIHAFEVLIPNFKNFSAACSIPFQMWDFEFGQPLGFRFKPTDFLGYLFLFKTISMRSAIFWLPAEWPSNHFFKAVFVWSCTVFFCTF